MAQVRAPWTPYQVDRLNAWQQDGRFHPFTCGGDRMDDAHTEYQAKHGGDFGQMVAEADGWRCPVCGYRQDWAHDFMAGDA
jgi:hypothetical protein